MTILWDHDPTALERYRYALGGDAVQLESGARVLRVMHDSPQQTLTVAGPDIDLDEVCNIAGMLRVDRPEVGVVLLRNRVDVTVLAQALRAGVREVIASDDHTALADAVRHSLNLSAQLAGAATNGASKEGRVITVFSAKGGVGKTTLSTNLAAYLASTGARTLLVDIDLMFGDVGISLQLTPHSSIMDAVAMSGHLDSQGVATLVTTHEASGLDVVTAPDDPADADRVPAPTVTELLRVARTMYDYVIVDTPPAFTEHVLAAFDVSDLTLLIATLDIPAVKNLRIAINTLDTLGAPKESRTIVLNRSDAKVGLTHQEVESALRNPISGSIPNSLAVPATMNRGVPIVLDDPKHPVSVHLREIADTQIRQRFGEKLDPATRRRSVPWGRR